METNSKSEIKKRTARFSDVKRKFGISLGLIILFMVFQTIEAQAREIRGVVTDDSNQPIVGASVCTDISKNCVITDIDGAYSIEVTEIDAYLVFNFIGYSAVKEKITAGKIMNVKMKAETTELEEVSVVGYSVRSEQKLMGAVAGVQLKSKSFVRRNRNGQKNVPVTNQDFGYLEHNTENYSAIHENGFKEVTKEPLSTFSVDVDRASYSNIRRFLNNGQLPPVDAVRIEEMINYFSYNYPQPEGDDPFSVNPEMAVCPWNQDHYLLKVGLQGKDIDKSELPPSNLVFLIDVSGSMNSANKLPLLKSAFQLLVNELRPQDRVAIVVYAGAAGLALESTPGSRKDKIMTSIQSLSAGGSTAGGAGLKLAYKIANENFIENGNNRIILATDGDFNVGVSSNSEMERLVEKERENGVFMTVLGFGMGNYKDDRMEIIADKGNGNYAYIDNLQEAQKTLVSEFGGTLFTIAKDVKFQIEFNPSKIAAYRLIGYENRLLENEDFNDDKKDAGEIGAGHTVTALYELVPADAPDAENYTGKVDPLKYQIRKETKGNSGEWLTLKLRYKKPNASKSILMEKTVKGRAPNFDEASEDLRFAASVAGFGMLLRGSEFAGNLSFVDLRKLAIKAKGQDEDGYRGEMVRLISLAKGMKRETALTE